MRGFMTWQPLAAADAEVLRAAGDTPPGTVVEVVDVPIDRTAAHSAMSVFAEAFDPFAGRHPGRFLAFTDQAAGSSTCTIDESTGLRIGIHVDNFYCGGRHSPAAIAAFPATLTKFVKLAEAVFAPMPKPLTSRYSTRTTGLFGSALTRPIA